MSGAYTLIHSALDLRTASFASAHGLEVAWENLVFRPRQGQAWLRPTLLPAQRRAAGLGAAAPDLLSGVYQVSLFAPAGQGWGPARALADALLAHFPRGATLASGGLRLNLNRSGCLPAPEHEHWYHLPVVVSWNCHAGGSA